jgi:hypothetical protein
MEKWRYKQHTVSTQHGDLISPGDGDGDILRQQHWDRDEMLLETW